ncbi:TetR/AcrR family transcriptional regulator [Gemmobacter serpentinus]|uniref:TetR/AcrR family transcriptional regulator n=1 Tax=Gemmobacter serpentinus TaxID=2652247 RepID=UPI00124EA6E2|nr:TetR family transcriptional regulator C-terminal domain-containing protein [Gemmobacter serpentinus]
MTGERRKFTRKSEDARREALIAAALELIAEGGPTAATVRAIAARAGVTPGLIRHYFDGKDDLTREAYRAMMAAMQADNTTVLGPATADPATRLAGFVTAALRPPVMDPHRMGLWAGFIHQVRSDPDMAAVHAETYLRYRDLLESLIADLGRHEASALRGLAIACNGVIDGLWLEGSALPAAFAPGELERIGLMAVGAILGLDLLSRHPAEEQP